MDLRGCRAKYRALAPTLTERSRRVWAASEARALGRGGITLVAQATGISTSTITRGLQELRSRAPVAGGRVRRPGGGRKRTIDKDPTLLRDLEGCACGSSGAAACGAGGGRQREGATDGATAAGGR